ncbi:hypothetical protein L3X38_006950 [Prunus dulcis]|uniref:Uncharacterized protein n=1 Tax=Prunus dulcis TaxID=3755 RepID=A0AAD4ZTL0_PRUDU|nr:hypothetical protein L3X38_006950 [Prunus dulcis]
MTSVNLGNLGGTSRHPSNSKGSWTFMISIVDEMGLKASKHIAMNDNQFILTNIKTSVELEDIRRTSWSEEDQDIPDWHPLTSMTYGDVDDILGPWNFCATSKDTRRPS